MPKQEEKQGNKPRQAELPHGQSPLADRRAHGKSLRELIARQDHATWKPSAQRRDPVEILEESNSGRIPELIPIRYGRMMASPFTFYRGSAALMAADLATFPVTGLRVQACGDCHLLNFGAYATPERNLVVDINDFDETLPAPWEWDLKRLTTSFVLACRQNGFKSGVARETAATVCRSYRTAMQNFSDMRVLDIWYARKTVLSFLADVKDKSVRKEMERLLEKYKQKTVADYYVPKLTREKNGRRVFKDTPPLVFHNEDQQEADFVDSIKGVVDQYKDSLMDDRRILFERYTLMDVAHKVVGIGSVGTLCGIALLMAGENDPLVLQVKEARNSVLEPYAGGSKYKNRGQRVVEGQRLMQAASDIFLGWTVGKQNHHFYIRQLKDMKISLTPESWDPERALEVAAGLGWVLARAHARSGDPAAISAYMGRSDAFDEAISSFSVEYADQTESDYMTFIKAAKSGRIETHRES